MDACFLRLCGCRAKLCTGASFDQPKLIFAAPMIEMNISRGTVEQVELAVSEFDGVENVGDGCISVDRWHSNSSVHRQSMRAIDALSIVF